MSDAVFQRTSAIGRIGTFKPARRLPIGYGLAIAAAASLGLWSGIFWLAARVLG